MAEDKNSDEEITKSGEPTEKVPEDSSPKSTDQEQDAKKKKYIFNCTKCGQCCENREYIPVSFADILNWTKSGTMNSIFQHLKIKTFQLSTTEKKQEYISLVLMGKNKGCPMFDKENRLCNIYHSLPLECKAFPLGFNGKNYYIKDKTVPGLGNGKMTKEKLIEDRDNARADFEAKVETQLLLPLTYSLFMQNLIEQQQKVMEEMPEEKRQQLNELLKSDKESDKNQ